jgi:CDP-3, 6-dideoxy-D-glycero-L-glycero-4-hexulose-4-reductase
MDKVCVITGGNGYVGSHLARYLSERGWKCHLPIRENADRTNLGGVNDNVTTHGYSNLSDLVNLFKEVNPTVTFHLAAAVITSNEQNNLDKLIQSNILFGTQILEAMKESDCRLFINTGTNWQNYNSDSYNPRDLYSATKEAFEKILQYYVDAYQVRAVTLRLFDIFGTDDRRPKIWNLLRDIAGTEQSIALSPGEQLIDLVYIQDVCQAYEKAYEYLNKNVSVTNRIFGVSNGERLSLKQLVGQLQSSLHKEIHVDFGGKPYRSREVMIPMQTYESVPDWTPTVKVKDMFTSFNNSGG